MRMHGVLCESDGGLDAFGNPVGDIMLMESLGKGLGRYEAVRRAEELKVAGRHGNVKVVELTVVEGLSTGGECIL